MIRLFELSESAVMMMIPLSFDDGNLPELFFSSDILLPAATRKFKTRDIALTDRSSRSSPFVSCRACSTWECNDYVVLCCYVMRTERDIQTCYTSWWWSTRKIQITIWSDQVWVSDQMVITDQYSCYHFSHHDWMTWWMILLHLSFPMITIIFDQTIRMHCTFDLIRDHLNFNSNTFILTLFVLPSCHFFLLFLNVISFFLLWRNPLIIYCIFPSLFECHVRNITFCEFFRQDTSKMNEGFLFFPVMQTKERCSSLLLNTFSVDKGDGDAPAAVDAPFWYGADVPHPEGSKKKGMRVEKVRRKDWPTDSLERGMMWRIIVSASGKRRGSSSHWFLCDWSEVDHSSLELTLAHHHSSKMMRMTMF